MKPITLKITGTACTCGDFSFSIALDASYKRGTITLTAQEALDLYAVLAQHHGDIYKAYCEQRQQDRGKTNG